MKRLIKKYLVMFLAIVAMVCLIPKDSFATEKEPEVGTVSVKKPSSKSKYANKWAECKYTFAYNYNEKTEENFWRLFVKKTNAPSKQVEFVKKCIRKSNLVPKNKTVLGRFKKDKKCYVYVGEKVNEKLRFIAPPNELVLMYITDPDEDPHKSMAISRCSWYCDNKYDNNWVRGTLEVICKKVPTFGNITLKWQPKTFYYGMHNGDNTERYDEIARYYGKNCEKELIEGEIWECNIDVYFK